VRPQLVVALGATAARALGGRELSVMRERGRPLRLRDGMAGLITVHPSYLLRLPDPAERAREHRRFVADLRRVASLVPSVVAAA
jgi:DNA polymerase